jgi:hypothetical protein
MIGGTDVILPVRSGVPATDVIFRTVRRHWPNFVYQDADDESAPFVAHTGPWLPEPAGREFFIYRDEQAARGWDEHGATAENANTMLYVLLGEASNLSSGLGSLTIVCGELTGEIAVLLEAIARGLMDAVGGPRRLGEAA